MKKEAIFDLAILLVTFCASWYFKTFLPSQLQGPFVVVSTSLTALLIIKIRNLSTAELGLRPRSPNKVFAKEVVQVALLIFAVQFIGLIVIGFLFGRPEAGSAVDNLPKTILGFILDNVLIVWIVTAFGEEFIFRGIIINRLKLLFTSNNSLLNFCLISGIQAIWFGMAHPSQGLSGILITGLIGFALGFYFLKNQKGGLWPLIIAHGLIDTIVLTANFI
ncbi:CPBP family intramembrane glutamic endopeptidase [Spongiimicrobium sp. 2-473A-2-J]|uniref:CPBP family intramembrane glutamic endopeptidase n=1 Tax=Eudoraea algarum TaxID=3417568 RepID=UPI003D360A5A